MLLQVVMLLEKQMANYLLYELSTFSDWIHKEYGTKHLNPWREATKYEERLNWAAYIHKSLSYLNIVMLWW